MKRKPAPLILRDKAGQILRVRDRVQWWDEIGVVESIDVKYGQVHVWFADPKPTKYFKLETVRRIRAGLLEKLPRGD